MALAGLVGYRQLPVAALPQVDYPTIVVATTLPGASPEVLEKTCEMEATLARKSDIAVYLGGKYIDQADLQDTALPKNPGKPAH